MLAQYVPHLILLVSMFLVWSLSRGGIPCVLTPFSSFLLVGRRPVISSILFFASSRTSWWGIATVSLVCHLRMASYVWRASRACSLAPSCRAAWLLVHSSSSILICKSLSLPASASASALMLP